MHCAQVALKVVYIYIYIYIYIDDCLSNPSTVTGIRIQKEKKLTTMFIFRSTGIKTNYCKGMYGKCMYADQRAVFDFVCHYIANYFNIISQCN